MSLYPNHSFKISLSSMAQPPTVTPSPAIKGYTNSAGITLAPIPAGTFQMGQAERQKSFKNPWSAEKDTGADWDESPVRQVKITHPFLMGVTEVTNAQYEQFDPHHHRCARRRRIRGR
jgi:formylglycine-generating enzyme required for sulfatase activity